MAEAPFEIWVGNLTSYVEGKLEGEWISLPQKEEDLKAAIAAISQNGKDEIAIMDYSFRPDCVYLKDCINEWSKATELNTIAKLIGDEEHSKVEAYINTTSGLSLSEIANLFMQEDEIPFYEYEFEGSDNPEVVNRLSNEEKMGYTLLERNGELKRQLEMMEIGGSSALLYLNIEAIGRDYSFSGATLYENGYYNMSESGPDLSYYTMEEIAEEIAAQEQELEEKREEEIQEETVKEKPQQRMQEKAPSL